MGDDMVSDGSVCIDRYEVSVWSSPTGGTQYGVSSDDYPAAWADSGQGCKAGSAGAIYARSAGGIYARSVPGVTPSRFITYFQARQALANSAKRLPSNAEWQQAVAGTPDSTACNVSTGIVASTGANAGCISNHGDNDMVGNSMSGSPTGCPPRAPARAGAPSATTACASRAPPLPKEGPGVLLRGANTLEGRGSGPFAVTSAGGPLISDIDVGFRGAR